MRITLIYLVLSIAMVVLSFNLFLPLLISALGGFWGKVLGAVVTILLISPFLRAMIMKKNHSIEFKALWADSRFNHAPLISIVLLRIVLAVLFVVYIIKYLFQASAALMVGIAILVVLLMIFSRFLKSSQSGWKGCLCRISVPRKSRKRIWERVSRNMPDDCWTVICTCRILWFLLIRCGEERP